jgi:hypothetical protein
MADLHIFEVEDGSSPRYWYAAETASEALRLYAADADPADVNDPRAEMWADDRLLTVTDMDTAGFPKTTMPCRDWATAKGLVACTEV